MNPSRILNVALLEVRNARRLVRFWVFAFVLVLFSLVGYVLSCFYLGSVAPVSPSHGAGAPLYLLGNIEPTFWLMYQAAILFLIFDATHQHSRNRIDEVLNSKPVSNLECLTGRVLGIAGLIWLIVAFNLVVMQLFGLVANATDFDFGDRLQLHSLINLLFLDAPTTLVFWGAFIVFLTQVLRFRLLIVPVGMAALLGWYTLVLEVPYSLLGVVSPSSNDTLFVSDLIPELASWSSVAIRLATVFLAGTLVLLVSVLLNRQDSITFPVSLSAASVLLLASVASFTFGALHVEGHFKAPQKWKEIHADYEWNHQIDITSIEGNVDINPGTRLELDLTIHFNIDGDVPHTFVFTLNPAMNITLQTLDDHSTKYSFKNGILEIENPSQSSRRDSHSLRVVAFGVPDPRFAYFDSPIEYMTDPGIQPQAVSMFGKDGSVFHSNYVALMPGAHWYPQPGVQDRKYAQANRGADYFDVDLQVVLKRPNWTVVGTGAPLADNGNSTFRLEPDNPVSEIGLLASDFRTDSFKIGGIECSLHLHRLHSRNLPLLSIIRDALQSEENDLFDTLNRQDLEIVHGSLAFVEVPRRLRTISGGWRMDSANNLPGIVLLKEHTFPTARLSQLFDRIDKVDTEESQLHEVQLEILAQYFQMGLATDNAWTSLPNRLWSDATSATGELSPALDQVMLSLISMTTRDDLHPFSIYWALNVVDMAQLSLFGAAMGLEGVVEADDQLNQGLWRTLQRLEDDYVARISTWNNVTDTALSDLPTTNGNQQDFELLMLKCSAIARALLDANGIDKIVAWLGSIRKTFFGTNFTYSDLLDKAQQHGLVVDPFLTEWIHTSKLPGYSFSHIAIARMEDDANGSPQYQTSVHIRNTEDVAGYVRLRYPNERTSDWRYPILTDTPLIKVESQTAKRINLVTPYEPRMVYLDPGLSLNRNEIALTRSSPSIEERLDSTVDPFEEESSWLPAIDIGIIVDDLDPGFVVFQSNPNLNRKTRVGPVGWIREPRLAGELDNGLPSYSGNFYMFEYRWTPGLWHRQTIEGGHGNYRTTTAQIWVRRGLELPKAVFGAHVPESGLWNLDYHFPHSTQDNWMQEGVYELNVKDESTSSPVFVKVSDLRRGWNKIGEFNLNAGTVHVEFVGASNIWRATADAIRWTKAEQH